MAEKSGFFDAHIVGGEYDRVYLAEDFAKYFSSFITNGIFGGKSNELMVRQASPSNMTISVSSGHAWINGYKYENTNDLSLTIDVADGVLNRIDAVVLRWGKAERKIWLAIKKGTPATKPVVPALQRDSEYYELKLAEVSVIAGAVNIVQSNITDTRLFSDVCGYVVGAVQQFDTTYFGAQLNAYVNEYAAEYKKWLDEMEVSGADELNEVLERLNALIDGDTVGLLTNEIERTKDRVLDIENGKPTENSYLVNDKIVALDIYEGAQLSMTSLIDPIQQGAGTASPNNVRHIVGHKALNLSRHGKNMWTTDAVYPLGNLAGGKLLYDATTQKYTIKANAASYTGNIYKLPVPIPAGVKVTATMFLEKGKLDVGTIAFGGFNDASGQWQCDVRVPEGGTLVGRVVTKTLTTTLPITHFRAFIYSDNVVTEDIVLRMQFEFGDAATTFELYRGDVFTTAFDNTIYGGEYNWETGKLIVNKTCVTLTGTENVELSEGTYGGHNLFVIRNSTNNVNTLKTAISSHGRQSNAAFELYADVGDFALWVSPERNASWFGILSDVSTVSEFKAYLAEQHANGTPYTMVYENYVPVVVWYVGQNVFVIQGKNYISSNAGNTKVLYTHVSKTYVEANFARKSVNGVVQSENADYAEVAEWNDGNPNGEDRVGYFVCVDVDTLGINIRKAGTFDNVRGVTMRNPAFSANCTPDKFDENGNLLPQFNHVGFAGFIPVIDNGTCTVGSYCMPGANGTAVPSINAHGYQVIERIDETHILILVEPGVDGHVRMQNEIDEHVADKNNPHGVTAEQVGARPNTWLPNIAEIGAAPSGYGLGGGAVFPSSVGLTNADIARSGFYRWDSGGQSAGFPFVYGTMIVNARVKDANAFQLAMSHADTYEGTMAARLYSANKEYPWEFINPPMKLGVEYRTTERYNGKPVYARLVNFGTMPNNTQKSISVSTKGVTQVVYAEGVARHSGGATHVPLGGHLAVAVVTEVFSTSIALTLQASTDFSAWSAIVLLKYVK